MIDEVKTELDKGNKVDGRNVDRSKRRSVDKDPVGPVKRRCVSTACIACRRRKSKCDGNLPKCAACASVYLTECEYAPHTDHRRKGVYKKDADTTRTKNSTLQTLIHAMLNYDEDDAFDLLRQARACDNLEELAYAVENQEKGLDVGSPDSPVYINEDPSVPRLEAELSGRLGDLVIDGSVKFIGGTSNLIWLSDADTVPLALPSASPAGALQPQEEAILSWTNVTKDKDSILHFINLYFCWHYAYFTTLSKELFYRDFLTGTSSQYCSSLLVNVMLALGCHFSSRPTARADPDESSTTGNHFFSEAKIRLQENDEFAEPKLCTVQALALMSVREAGCGRESTGWVYSGMSFRMASDLGLNVEVGNTNNAAKLTDNEIDARRITFWGCFLFDKCWSNYLGRQPQLLSANIDVHKPEVFASEDAEIWAAYTDSGLISTHNQPARTRAVALQIFKLGEISSDLLSSFYNPHVLEKPMGKQAELKQLSDIHTRLESWKKELPAEMDPKDGQLPQILLMQPFLKYTKTTSPLPAHISPRKFCTQAAGAISKLFRFYKRTHGLRQICNIAVYIAHSACTIHLLNLPDKNAKRDIIHGVKQLKEIGEFWTCAKRTLRILALCADKWKIELPEEIRASIARTRLKWGSVESSPAPGSPEAIASLPLQVTVPSGPSMQPFQDTEQLSQPPPLVSPERDDAVYRSLPVSNHPHSILPINTSAPNQQVTEATKNKSHLRPLTQLTKAQQDAWNAHQARMASFTDWPQGTSSETQRNAAVLFGGVDSLMVEPRDWWLKDQSQLAAGFGNWTSPVADWSHGGTSMTIPITDNDQMTGPSGSNQYFSNDLMASAYSSVSSAVQGPYGFGTPHSHTPISATQQQQLQPVSQQQHIGNMNHMPPIAVSPVSDENTRNRTNTFHDEIIYY